MDNPFDTESIRYLVENAGITPTKQQTLALVDEITKLRAALSEALASLDLAISDCLLMALASKRALAKFKDADGEPCRWCGSKEDIHRGHCPSHVLVDIGFVGLIGDEVMRRSMEKFVEEEDRKRREARS